MSIPGAHLNDLGYYEARPGDIEGRDVLILDLRSASSVGEGRIASAQLFDAFRDGDWLRQFVPLALSIVVVCEDGVESKAACERLVVMGYSSVHHLVGGMRRWRAEGRAVERGPGFQTLSEPFPARGASA